MTSKFVFAFGFFLIVFSIASESRGQSSEIVAPSRSLDVQRNEKNQIIKIDFPYGQTIQYTYSDSGKVIAKEMSGFLVDYQSNSLLTKKVSQSEIEEFNYLILKDMSERIKVIPTLTQTIKHYYSSYVENMGIEKKDEKLMTEKAFIKKMFGIFGRYYKKQLNQRKINNPQASQLLLNLSNCETYQPCIDSLVNLKKIMNSKFPTPAEKTIDSQPDLNKIYNDFISSYEKCIPVTISSNLKKLVDYKKIRLNDALDAGISGRTELTDSPEKSFIGFRSSSFTNGFSNEVGAPDKSTRIEYYSDQDYNHAKIINYNGEKYFLDTIIHEYGHLLQYTKFSLHSKLIENSVMENIENLVVPNDTVDSQEEDVMAGLNFDNINSDIRDPHLTFQRLIESGASYFAFDSMVGCL